MKVRVLSRRQSNTQSINEDEDAELIQKQEYIAAQKSLQHELEFEQGMLVEREQRILQIEGDILDINQIMRELGAMVHEQGEAVSEFFYTIYFSLILMLRRIKYESRTSLIGIQETQRKAFQTRKFKIIK